MSYDKVIGFGIDENNPKGPLRALNIKELSYFYRMGVEPIFHDLKKMMGADNREPEKKIIVPGPKSFLEIRDMISSAKNAFLIPGQTYTEKNPLTSVLMDTVERGYPSARLDAGNYTLRYRFEMDPHTGVITQGDYNEKSGMRGGAEIGGCTDRFERELEQRPGESLGHAYNAFLTKYRRRRDPAFCNDVSFDDLRVFGGYQAARNEVGFAVKRDNVLMVFEACEDFWHMLDSQLVVIDPPKFFEFEFEPKQVWGVLPAHARTKEGFKSFVYNTMSHLESYIQNRTAGSYINAKSKAEMTKEHIEGWNGFQKRTLAELGLSQIFSHCAPPNSDFSALQYSLWSGGQTLEDAISWNIQILHNQGAKLYTWKQDFNEMAGKNLHPLNLRPHNFTFHNDNATRHVQPIAALGLSG